MLFQQLSFLTEAIPGSFPQDDVIFNPLEGPVKISRTAFGHLLEVGTDFLRL